MSFLSYGNIFLEPILTETLDFTANYVGLDYISTTVTIGVKCIFNPQATSYFDQSSAGQTPNPAQQYGNSPTDTLNAIRNVLLQPRNQLTFNNGDYMIISPPDGIQVDFSGGPFPINVNVEQIIGETSFIVNFTVRTDILECYLQTPIVSNRWASSWVTDAQMRNRITYSGKAVLALNSLLANDFQPGQFIKSILPYIAPFYFRESININYLEDQHTIEYQCTDVERFYYSLGDLTIDGSPAQVYNVTSFESKILLQSVNIAGDFGVSMTSPGISLANISGTVYGNERSVPGGLVSFALQLAIEKFGPNGPLGLNYKNLSGLNYEISKDKPEITFSISVVCGIAGAGPPAPANVFVGALNQNLLLNDPSIDFLEQYVTNPELSYGGLNQLVDQTIQPIFQSILGACTSPCNLAVPFGTAFDPCQGPENCYYLTTPIVKVTNQQWNNPSYNTLYNGNASSTYNYEVVKSTWSKLHTMVAPVTSPPPSSSGSSTQSSLPIWATVPFEQRPQAEVLSLAAPISGCTVSWYATGINGAPPVPSPVVADGNMILVDSWVSVYDVSVGQDGVSTLTRIEGKYEFVNQTPVLPGDNIGGACLPYLSLTYNDNYVGADLWMDGIIDDGSAGQFPGGSQRIVN